MGIIPPRTDKYLEYWNLPVDNAELGVVPADILFLDVVVDNLPDGLQILQVLARFKFSIMEDDSGAPNATVGAQEIQMMRPGVGWTTVIDVPAGFFALGANARDIGYMLTGDVNPAIVAALVDRNANYNVQWTQALAIGSFIHLYNIQVGLKIFYN